MLLKQLAPLMTHGTAPTKENMAGTPRQPLPDAVLHRAKTGFNVPVREWVARGTQVESGARGLRGWALHLDGVFHP